MREHRPSMAMALYYPRRVTPAMGPTFVLPFSQYATVDAEGSAVGEDRLGAGLGPAEPGWARLGTIGLDWQRLGPAGISWARVQIGVGVWEWGLAYPGG